MAKVNKAVLAENSPSYHHGNLHQELLVKGLEQLKRVGPDKVSLRALAREIGVSQTAPYRHYADKNALLAALAAQGYSQLSHEIGQASLSVDDDEERFMAVGLAYIHFARTNPELYKLMFGSVLACSMDYPEFVEAGQQAFTVILDHVQQGINHKLFAQKDPRMLGYGAWAMVHGIASLWIDGMYECSDSDEEIIIVESLRLLLHGILQR
jgi:AcrR family transcriptional regulator